MSESKTILALLIFMVFLSFAFAGITTMTNKMSIEDETVNQMSNKCQEIALSNPPEDILGIFVYSGSLLFNGCGATVSWFFAIIIVPIIIIVLLFIIKHLPFT